MKKTYRIHRDYLRLMLTGYEANTFVAGELKNAGFDLDRPVSERYDEMADELIYTQTQANA